MRRLSLHTRISLVLTALAASLLLVLAGVWLHGARTAIHEEVEAASRVSEQWLQAMLGEMRALPPAVLPGRVLAVLRPLGRIRANALVLSDAAGRELYRSPGPTYKAGRAAPAWFATLLTPSLAAREITAGDLRLVLTPDASRAVIDTWDDLLAMAGWAGALLGLLFTATRLALDRALRPLAQVMDALDRTGRGRFDIRLPVFATPELARLSRAFNGMANRLRAAVDDNVRLETAHEVAEQMQARLQAERQSIARELHDELAQGITAVRALAGAIVQRAPDVPALHIPAQSIVAVTGEMQDGVRNILQRLRPASTAGLEESLNRLLAGWQARHPDIELSSRLAIDGRQVADEMALAVLRCIQEGLTNVVRHAAASRVTLTLLHTADGLRLTLADNGRGRGAGPSGQPGCGLGLTGMSERIAALGGRLEFTVPPSGGFAIDVRLPDGAYASLEEQVA